MINTGYHLFKIAINNYPQVLKNEQRLKEGTSTFQVTVND